MDDIDLDDNEDIKYEIRLDDFLKEHQFLKKTKRALILEEDKD